jgi:hypothetical protein
MDKDKEALKRAKNQAKIDKIEGDLVLFENAISKNRAIFEEDGEVDSKEQKQLDKMEKKILKIRNKLSKLGWVSDGDNSNLDEDVQVEIERLISKMQELIESIQL